MNIAQLELCQPISLNGALIDPQSLTIVSSQKQQYRLEPRLMMLLQELLHAEGEVISRQKLIDSVWSSAYASDENLTQAISQLRAKLKAAQIPVKILTVPKIGYRLESDSKCEHPKAVTQRPWGEHATSGIKWLTLLLIALIIFSVLQGVEIELQLENKTVILE